ncbi:MAG TPA: two-component regulator propeller domain-containing protein [Aridibacter sp.]|nr:two-component regulator propeller domain-containing protein [Aridibacter sp.]
MRETIWKKLAGIVILSAIVLAGSEAFRLLQSIQQALFAERTLLKDESTVIHKRTVLTPQNRLRITLWQDHSTTRGLALYRDSIFAATSGGLVEYTRDGKIKKIFTVLEGLPESDLTSVAAFDGRLFIGTRTKGLLDFDGATFARYEWPGRNTQAITSLVNDSDIRLFIGTFNGGLLTFSGGTFTERKAENRSIGKITAIDLRPAGLVVSTYDNGVWISEGTSWTRIGRVNGLPSDRAVGTAVLQGRLYVATDLGIAVCEGNTCIPKAQLPAVSGLFLCGGRITFSRENGDVFVLSGKPDHIDTAKGAESGFTLAQTDGRCFATGNSGIYEIRGDRLLRFATGGERGLSEDLISSIHLSSDGQLWVGTFRGGVDVFTRDGRLLRHLEDDSLSEINHLSSQPDGSVIAATSRGLVRIDRAFKTSLIDTAQQSGAVNHFSRAAMSTARGLLTGAGPDARRITAEQRLPSNSVYTSLETGDSILAGTLSGLARIRGGRVVSTWRSSNSGLTTNWVTALAKADGRIFIGTYGGGIFELTPSDEIRPVSPNDGKVVINLNALATDGGRLYAGTMKGLAVLDLSSGRWVTIADGLPSAVVFSVACDDRTVFVGTTNGIAVIDRSELGQLSGGAE